MRMATSLLTEILQPRTDAGAIAQWIVVLTVLPTTAVVLHRHGLGDVARFVIGVGFLALAWFAIRAFH